MTVYKQGRKLYVSHIQGELERMAKATKAMLGGVKRDEEGNVVGSPGEVRLVTWIAGLGFYLDAALGKCREILPRPAAAQTFNPKKVRLRKGTKHLVKGGKPGKHFDPKVHGPFNPIKGLKKRAS